MTSERWERAAAWMQTWDGQGIHRTASAGDQAGADWLAGEAERLGARVAFETFEVERVDPIEAHVEVDGVRIEGVKMFDSPDTAATGTESVRVIEAPPFAVYSSEFRVQRQEGVREALVVVTTGERPGLALLNAESFTKPFGGPVLQVSSHDRDRVVNGTVRRVTITSRQTRSIARNVVVTIPGSDLSGRPLVVMTPRSSWWQSTAERGGGLVCWLEVLRALMAAPPRQSVVMTANTGHELGHIGLDEFLAQRTGWEQPGGATWVHFGANIGASEGRLVIQSSSADLRTAMARELDAAGRPGAVIAPEGAVPNGETRDIHVAGGRYLTLVGTNSLFHLPDDRWPHAVDVDSVVATAAAAAKFVAVLAG
jgi:hypothetical protein